MKNIKQPFLKCILSFFIAIFLFACAASDDANNTEKTVTVSIPAKLSLQQDAMTFSASLKATTFVDARKYSTDLAQASFCLTIAADKEEYLKSFFKECGFDTVQLQHTESNQPYDYTGEADGISYGLAHYRDNDYDVIAVAIRGISYTYEWISNIDLGTEGDHTGFSSAAKKIYIGLKAYIEKYYADSYKNGRLKLWIGGYSRAGAVSNVLAYYILTGLESDDTYTKFNIDPKDVFVYTFGTPRSLCKAHAEAYPNVFNFVSDADIVTYIAPEAYDFYRCGIDKLLFTSSTEQYKREETVEVKTDTYTKYKVSLTSPVDDWMKEYKIDGLYTFCNHTYREFTDNQESETEFPGDTYATEKECIEYYLNLLLGTEKTGGISMKTRKSFVETAQPTIEYILRLFLGNTDKLVKAFGEIKTEFIYWIFTPEAFYNGIKGLFDSNEIQYEETELKKHCNVIYNAVDLINHQGGLTDFVATVVPLLLSENKDLLRSMQMHFPEVTCAALLKYK